MLRTVDGTDLRRLQLVGIRSLHSLLFSAFYLFILLVVVLNQVTGTYLNLCTFYPLQIYFFPVDSHIFISSQHCLSRGHTKRKIS